MIAAGLTDAEKDRLLNADSRSHMLVRVEHIVSEAVGRERAAWVAKIEALIDHEWVRGPDLRALLSEADATLTGGAA